MDGPLLKVIFLLVLWATLTIYFQFVCNHRRNDVNFDTNKFIHLLYVILGTLDLCPFTPAGLTIRYRTKKYKSIFVRQGNVIYIEYIKRKESLLEIADVKFEF